MTPPRQVTDAARRHAVWLALADLYLDTELGDEWLRQIARVVVASGYAWAKIKRINYDEVAPALWFNVQDVAGEWAGWNDAWVLDRITSCYTGRPRKTLGSARLWQRRVDQYTAHYLAEIFSCLP
jgi:hypothetical protein